MGTHTQSVMDREASDTEEAKRLGESIIAWLIEQEIILNKLTDCCHGPGHPPGPHFMRACAGTPEDSGEFAYAQIQEIQSNGVELSINRNVFFNAQGNYGPARCPHCDTEHDIDLFYQATSEWMNGGPGEIACTQCARVAPVTAWEHDDLLVGALGLQFWNWPELSADFLLELQRHSGHRWSRIFGKL